MQPDAERDRQRDRRGGAIALGQDLLIARLFAGCALALVVVVAPAQSFPEPRTVAINDRVFVLLGPVQHANRLNQGYMINATVIVGSDGVILVDSGASHEVGQHLADAVRRITAKPVTHVVNTHHHGDHTLGNTAFPGATFISSDACRRLVAETGRDWIAIMENDIGRKLPRTRPRPADVTFGAGQAEGQVQGVRVVFWVPDKGAHTEGDLLVYLPDDKVLVAGDVLVNGVVPTFQDGFVRNWIRLLDEIAALDATHFVPGHGDLMTDGDVSRMREQMKRFYEGVSEAYRRGLAESEIRKSLDLTEWERLERAYVIGRNINRAYLEAEVEWFGK